MKRFIPYPVAVLLVGVIVVRGIIPGLTTVDTDFPNYYTASRIVLEGKDPSRLYDDVWFEQQTRSYAIAMPGRFSPFPPITAFIMLPFAWLQPLQALQIWTLVNIVLCGGCLLMLRGCNEGTYFWNALLIAGSGLALINNFRFGQFYLVMTTLLVAAYSAHRRHSHILTGILLGFGAAFKYYPIVFLPLHIARKEWGVVLACIGTVIAMYTVAVFVLGIHIHEEFITTIFSNHILGNIQNLFSATFQSWDSLLRKMFVTDAAFNPSPLFPSLTAFILGKIIIIVSVIITVIRGSLTISRSRHGEAYALTYALIGIAALVLLPASATYHFLFLILPVGLLLSSPMKQWSAHQYIILSAFLVIGYLPYRFFRVFETSTVLFPLAYPRLALMTVLLVATFLHIQKICREQKAQPLYSEREGA